MKVLIVDDHALVARALASLLESQFESAEVSVSTQVAEAKALYPASDLVLLDLHLPGEDTFALLTEIRDTCPSTRVVIMSGDAEASRIREALGKGAAGFIPKAANYDIVKHALHLVMSGGVYVPPEMLAAQVSAPPVENDLTPRQMEVLQLLYEGKSNKEIARLLDCADTTVKAHMTAIFRSLNARNRTEAVVEAQRLGLV